MTLELRAGEIVDARVPRTGVAVAAAQDIRKVRIKTVIIRTEITRSNQRDGKPKIETTTVRTRTKIKRSEQIRQFRGPHVSSRTENKPDEVAPVEVGEQQADANAPQTLEEVESATAPQATPESVPQPVGVS